MSQKLETIDGDKLRTDWSELVTRGYNPAPLARNRIALVGGVGSGKSTFAASIPRSLRISFEEEYSAIKHERGYRVYIPTDQPTFLTKVIDKLLEDAKYDNRQFDTVVWDPIDGWQAYEEQRVLAEFGKESIRDVLGGKGGFDTVAQRMIKHLNAVYAAGYGWVAIAHEAPRYENNTRVIGINAWPKVKDAFLAKCEYICYCERATRKVKKQMGSVKTVSGEVDLGEQEVAEEGYRMLTRDVPHASSDVKSRVPISAEIWLPEQNAWDILAKEYENAVAKVKSDLNEKPE